MSHNKVVWSDGLFLRPQHFQQQERYFEHVVNLRCRPLVPYDWGLTRLEIDTDNLKLGKFGLRRAAGVFPDGTPMQLGDEDPPPEPIEVPENASDQIVYLGVPERRNNGAAVGRANGTDALVRYHVREATVADATGADSTAAVEVGALRTRLLLTRDSRGAYSCIPIAHIVECRSDREVVLDWKFIPTVLNADAAPVLRNFNDHVRGLMTSRAGTLAGRVTATSTSAVPQFLLLMLINGYLPVVEHLTSTPIHPEALYRFYMSAIGQLATITAPTKRPPLLPAYDHTRLRETFEPLMIELERSLTEVIPETAIPIEVKEREYGVWLARVGDKDLFKQATFVLGIKTAVDVRELRPRVPNVLKVGAPDQIARLVSRAIESLVVHDVPTPRQIPFHSGFVYFQFDQTHESWKRMQEAGALAFHLGGEFPGLELELWAIRG